MPRSLGPTHVVSVSGHKQLEGRDGANLMTWQAISAGLGAATCIWAGPLKEVDEGTLAIHRRPRSSGPGGFRWVLWAARQAHSAATAATARGEAVVLNGADPVGWIAVWLAIGRLPRMAWVMDVHGDLLQLPPETFGLLKRKSLGSITIFFGRRASLVRVVSEPIRVSLEKNGIASRLLPSRLLPLWEAPVVRDIPPFGSRQWRLLAVGSLIPTKGFDLLIEAFADVASSSELAAELVIVGDGPEHERLKTLAEARGVQDRVNFRGYLSPESLRRELEASDLLVISSRSEGLPRVLLEGVATKLPVVATAVGGIPHVARGLATVRTVLVDTSSIAAGLLETAEDPPTDAALDEARAAVVHEYGFQSNIARVCGLYEELLLGHG